jgi:uncharacterized membrane protein
MTHFLKVYAATTAVFLSLDFAWLGVLMSGFYRTELGAFARRSGTTLAPIWWAAAVVYLIIPIGIVLFVVPKAMPGSFPVILFWGFVFGAIVYGVYDFTNYSTLDNWSLRLALVDTVWGGTVCALSATAGAWTWRSGIQSR